MIIIEDLIATSTTGKFVHRKNTSDYGISMTLFPGEVGDSFEEVDSVPEIIPDETTRSQRIEQLIRKRYSVSDELAILRQRDTKPDEFAEYNAYAEQCKIDVDSH